MCTVTIVPHARGVRVVCNRDELRSRPSAEPPAWQRIGALRALWPRDPESGGTWIGVNTAGLATVLLNRNPRPAPAVPAAPRSRGTLIPQLLGHRRLGPVLEAVSALDPSCFEPFTLVIVQRGELVVVENARGRISTTPRSLSRPLLFTSSSLGDHLVARPRRDLFRRVMERAASPLAAQAVFHRHRWPRRPEISVWMSRPDASTVSRTVVDLGRRSVRLGYEPLGDSP